MPVVTSVSAWLRRPGTRILDLEGIDADSLLINALPAPVYREPLAVAPWAALPADPDTYLAARPGGFRKNLRQASSRLAAEGANHRVNRGSSAIRSLVPFGNSTPLNGAASPGSCPASSALLLAVAWQRRSMR